MFAPLLRRTVCSLLLATLSLSPSLLGQELNQLTFTLGTTGINSSGEDFGYLVLQTQEAEAVLGRPYAIYEKTADFDTPAPFVLRAVIQLQTDPRTIRSILNASAEIDSDFHMLENRIDGYFEDLDISTLGASGQEPDLADKVSFAVRSAQAKPELFEGLYFLGRLHPGINCVLGLGYFGDLNNPLVTWELREWDPTSGQATGVVGRVLLDLNEADPALGYPTLPAPGKPIDVPFPISLTTYENDPRGHLNVRLRWHTPEALREESLLALGYNVYRLAAQDAIDLGWVDQGDDKCPAPTIADVLMLLDAQMLTQVNIYPIMPASDLTEAESEDITDSETFFTADDDDRFEPDATDTFTDGDEFYYFVGTQDLLRRPGEVSDGHYVKICDQKPPLPVDEVKVDNYFKASTNPAEIEAHGGEQHLEVSWRQLEEDGGEPLDDYKYYIYRWDSPQEMLENAANPLSNLVAGPLNHNVGEAWQTWVDQPSGANPDSPSFPDDASRTYYYTVRVEDASECGGNMSANSASAFGALRDRRPLEDPSGTVTTRCLSVQISPKGTELFNRDSGENGILPIIRVAVTRTSPDIEWADVNIDYGKDSPLDPFNLDRLYFAPGDDLVMFDFQPLAVQSEVRIQVSGGDRFGNRSGSELLVLNDIDPSSYQGFEFLFELEQVEIMTEDRSCGPHIVVDRLFPGGRIVMPTLTITVPEGAKEYKLYRSIDDGEPSLITQGEVADIFTDLEDFDFEEFSLPSAPQFTICYYVQMFDEHGNESAFVPVSECIEFIREYPAPLLVEPEAYAGANDESMAQLTWYCAPAGVEQFEVWVASSDGASPGDIGDDLEELSALGPRKLDGDPRTYYVYQTRRLATVFGQSAPEFSIDALLDRNNVYTFKIRAVSGAGIDARATGPFSNSQLIAWTLGDSAAGPNVAWPDRDLPGLMQEELSDAFFGVFGMEIIRDEFNGPVPALRIGQFTLIDTIIGEVITYDKDPSPVAGFTPFLMPEGDPVTYTSHRSSVSTNGQDAVSQSIFPFALYRYRVDAPIYRERSNTVEQVSPLMREIAHESGVIYDIGKPTPGGDDRVLPVTRIRDPYFQSREISTYDGTGPTHDLYMLDFTPVQMLGTYQYLMVFFTERGEIETVLPLNQITIQ